MCPRRLGELREWRDSPRAERGRARDVPLVPMARVGLPAWYQRQDGSITNKYNCSLQVPTTPAVPVTVVYYDGVTLPRAETSAGRSDASARSAPGPDTVCASATIEKNRHYQWLLLSERPSRRHARRAKFVDGRLPVRLREAGWSSDMIIDIHAQVNARSTVAHNIAIMRVHMSQRDSARLRGAQHDRREVRVVHRVGERLPNKASTVRHSP